MAANDAARFVDWLIKTDGVDFKPDGRFVEKGDEEEESKDPRVKKLASVMVLTMTKMKGS